MTFTLDVIIFKKGPIHIYFLTLSNVVRYHSEMSHTLAHHPSVVFVTFLLKGQESGEANGGNEGLCTSTLPQEQTGTNLRSCYCDLRRLEGYWEEPPGSEPDLLDLFFIQVLHTFLFFISMAFSFMLPCNTVNILFPFEYNDSCRTLKLDCPALPTMCSWEK